MVEPGKEVFHEAGRVVIQSPGQDAEPDDEQHTEEPVEAGGDE